MSQKTFQAVTDPFPALEARRIEDVLNKEQSMVFSAYPIAGIAEEDFYIGGTNIGFEIHGNYDCTVDIKNFNITSYNRK